MSKRTIQIKDSTYKLIELYKGITIYKESTPTGIFISNSWCLLSNEKRIVILSYNNKCKEELLDDIDEYIETGKFNYKGFWEDSNTFVVHNGYNVVI